MNIIGVLMKLLGLGQGASVLNNLGGVANHATLAAFAVWAWSYRAQPVVAVVFMGEEKILNVETTAGALMVLGAVLWGIGELFRRSRGAGQWVTR